MCHIIAVALVVCLVGKTVNYAIVVAMLYSLGKNHGPHSFVVQLRDLKSHEPLPGDLFNFILNKLKRCYAMFWHECLLRCMLHPSVPIALRAPYGTFLS